MKYSVTSDVDEQTFTVVYFVEGGSDEQISAVTYFVEAALTLSNSVRLVLEGADVSGSKGMK